MFVLFAVIIYFCLDMFEIIRVPERYSLVDFLSSKVRVMQGGEEVELVPVAEKENNTVNRPIVREQRQKNDIELTSPFSFTQVEETPATQTQVQSAPEEEIQTQYQEPVSNVLNHFYYDQLDMYGQVIYEELLNHVEDLKTGLYTANFGVTFNSLLHEENGAEVLENAFQLAVNSLVFDRPEIFFLDITKMYLYTEITSFGPKKTYRITIGPGNNEPYLSSTFSGRDSVNGYKYRMDEIVNSLAIESRDYSLYDKIRVMHDYIVENTEYDSTISKPNIYNMYGAFIGGEAVCEGYSKAFKYAMDRLDLPCIIVCGKGVNSQGDVESHAWNYVKINDEWYAVDVTWDDPIIIGYGNATNKMRYHYFLVGSNDFFTDHTEDGTLVGNYRFKYPAISLTKYK
jgi:hypothetical protein